ncbi:MAG: damage-control phosphatase ARMT1 family protein [Candidatus Syntropharchaeia archaeon]
MKVKPECLPCLFERAEYECNLVFDSDDKKMEMLGELLRFAAEKFTTGITPVVIGTERERILKRVSGNEDPYAELKRKSNEVAVKLLPIAEKFYENSSDKAEALIRIAAAANSMEYGVRGHSYDHSTFYTTFEKTLHEKLVGDVEEIKSSIGKYKKILYLTDNAGEIVFDAFVANNIGKEVILSPKKEPILNDATVEDAEKFFSGRIVPNGSYVGISLEEAPEDFLELFWSDEYFVIAKGMGNYESISEFDEKLRGRLAYIFRAKCLSVARSVGVEKGDLVAKLV